MNILEEANALIYGEKEKEHGNPLLVYKVVAALWTAYIGYPVSTEDVFQMLSLMKKARYKATRKNDDVLDDAGYVGLVDRARKAGL